MDNLERMCKRSFLLITIFTFINTLLIGQDVSNYINQVNLYTVEKTVRELSGEDSVYVNGSLVRILNRGDISDNDLAANYIRDKLQGYGLDVFEHYYSDYGKNVIATQEGVGNTDSILLISAHYDAVTTFCADDNASGCSAVIEAARILSSYDFKHTIKYIFFDEEEDGLVGSQAYVSLINLSSESIISVINMDMLGYESQNSGGDYDGEFDVISNGDPASIKMKDVLFQIIDNYNLNLNPILLWNIGGSDHQSFWDGGYPAICYSEAFHSGDPNPYYHSTYDRINEFHMPYFLELVKLGVGAIAQAAIPVINTFTQENNNEFFKIYPNPSDGQKEITISKENLVTDVHIYQLLGGNNSTKGVLKNGKYIVKPNTLMPGLYVVKIINNDKVFSKKLVIY